ncbi:hypothetical protein [Burkholderia sp. L27(2015)]|uniref:hypothetical protein n=1 Tax=Burkholderia sp. L27(2015) TaxID=1641858 RepID=UPI00131ABF1B|nr:hypothetical protein [Burkholderia sp. L27(2015)]
MEITTTIGFDGTARQDLATILGCADADLEQTLAAYSAAALDEYIAMFRGQKVLKRGSDFLEFRLSLLIAHAFGGVIPDEQRVSNLFQTSATESRSLIRAVMSKYQYQMRSFVDQTLTTLLARAECEEEGGVYYLVIQSQNLVDELNRILASIDGNLPPVARKKGSVATFEINPSSYERLRVKFNLPLVAPRPQ